MEISTIPEAPHRHPFHAFTLRLADGRALTVPHSDFVAIPEIGRRIAVFSGPEEALSILEPLLIVSIEYAGTGRDSPPRPASAG